MYCDAQNTVNKRCKALCESGIAGADMQDGGGSAYHFLQLQFDSELVRGRLVVRPDLPFRHFVDPRSGAGAEAGDGTKPWRCCKALR